MKRIVITGLGVISSNGIGVKEYWENICSGKSGIRVCTKIDTTSLITNYAGEISGFCAEDYFTKEQLQYTDNTGRFALFAANECIMASNLKLSDMDPYRVGLIVGTSLGGHLSGDLFHEQWIKNGIESTDASLLLSYPLHAIADTLCNYLKIKGPKSIISTACAAGANAVGYAFDLIRNNKANVMLAGGVDPLSRLSFAGFNSLQALDQQPCSPYSRSKGITLGEGAGFLLLEDLKTAKKRGAKILGEVLSYALSADAYHPTAPDLGGAGAIRSMKAAIDKSGLKPSDVDYINGHGTGTSANDNVETKAIKAVFSDSLSQLCVSSTKGATGHCLGAAGAIEAVTSVLAVNEDKIPPTINFSNEANKYSLNLVTHRYRNKECRVALSNSFAFGGNNASLLFSKYDENRQPVIDDSSNNSHRIVITGVGTVGSAGNSFNEFSKIISEGIDCTKEITEFDTRNYTATRKGLEHPVEWKRYISPGNIRRLDAVTKTAMVAAKQSINDASLKITRLNCENIGVIYGTGTGPITTIEEINRTIILDGIEKVNPGVFPNSVMNAAPGNICINYMIKGPTSTICAGGVSTSSAITYAYELLKNVDASAIVVVGADECNESLIAGNDRLNMLSSSKIKPLDKKADGMVLSSGSTAFLIETYESAIAREAHIYCEILGYGMTCDNHKLKKVNPQGDEWIKSFEKALESSGIKPEEVDFLAAASCGITEVDMAEARAIESVFGKCVSVSAVQSIIGHSMGGIGGFGMLSAIHAMETKTIHPTINVETLCNENIDVVLHNSREKEVNKAVVSSFAFGGNYVTLCLGKI